MVDPVIVTENLTYTYPNSNEATLKDVDLEVKKGEFVLITGKSGCGKSTLARCMNGLIPHLFGGKMDGRVLIHGKDTKKHPTWELARHIGLVFQNPESQLFTLAVEDEVAFGPENFGVPREDIEKRVDWTLTSVGMNEFRFKPVFNLSDGQKQRVAIAANLSMLPDILVLDEPTSNLDPKGAREVFGVLKYLKEEHKKTIILIEHRTNYAVGYVDKVIIMDSGEIALTDSPGVLFKAQLLKKFGVRAPEPIFLFGDANQHVASENHDMLKTENLSYAYDGNGLAIQRVDMTIQKGETVGIMGPNGSGKTTLVKHFVGLLKPNEGRVLVDGIDTQKADVSMLAEKVGLVLQNSDHQLFMDSVYNEVSFGVKNMKSEKEIEERVEDVLRTMDLWRLKDRHPHSLSDGEKQRVTIAAVLTRRSDVLILDEPTSGMDGYHMDLLVDKLSELKKSGLTMILVSHDIEMISKLAPRTVVMSEGKIVNDGPTSEIIQHF
ncbi:MAG: energy-coupling factor ABC transporter ATP-binding protein [Methanosarcinales archaeon]|nr:MAG: energy-coupling factor ABC transporter ATP-binding protein [Methanosarcinales archaeon]